MKFVEAIIIFAIITRFKCQTAVTNNSQLINRNYEKYIGGSMDLEADPCEDFYQYACGEWETYHDNAEENYNEILTYADYKANRQINIYLKKLKKGDHPRFVTTAHAFYKSCLRVDEYDPSEYIRWMKVYENLTWPVEWSNEEEEEEKEEKEKHYDWVHTLGVMRRYGLNGILIESTMVHKKDEPTKLILDLDKPVENEGFQNMTYENFEVLLDSHNAKLKSKKIKKLWREIRDFEERLMTLDEIEDEEDPAQITVKELPLHWLSTYLGVVLNQSVLDPSLELNIQNINYLKALDELLKEYDDSFICKYLGIRFLWHLHLNAPSDFSSWECVQTTRSLLPLAIGWIYEQHHPELAEEIPAVHQVFDNILRTFNKSLQTNKIGYSESIQQFLLDKLDSVKLKIGNLPRIDTVEVLESHYEDLHLSPGNFYGNHLKLLHFYFNNRFSHKSIGMHQNVSNFFHLDTYEEAVSSTPYYLPLSNIIIVPITIIRKPVYHSKYEDVYVYSSLGSALAHELFHSFDYSGLEFDSMGKTNAKLYDKILEHPKFDHNYKCVRDLDPDVVDEKIADISGLRYAYDTFAALHPEDLQTHTRTINGVEMSLQKLFFLNFAQYYCDSSEPDEDADHGQASDRVKDALSQMKEFAIAYNCTPQSEMIPEEICQLW